MLETDIKNWINKISEPKKELDGFPVCPFAKNSSYEVIETDGGDISPPPWDFELIIYKLPDDLSIVDLQSITDLLNEVYPEYVFLPDQKDRDTFISGVQTNNGIYNLILCQWKDKLLDARSKLSKTKYYDYWDPDYLEEILKSQ